MTEDFKKTLNKLIAGGCGIQLGMIFTCGLATALVFVCLACAGLGTASLTLGDVAQQISRAQQAEPSTPQTEPLSYIQAEEPAPILPDVPAAAPETIAQPVPASVTELPAAGAEPESGPPPIVTAAYGRANLRTGPDTAYARLGILPANASLPIAGRTANSTWWLVSTTEGLAWVYGAAVALANVNDTIPVIAFDAPPPPAELASATISEAPKPPAFPMPAVTPTAPAAQQRLFVGETVGYKWMTKTLMNTPNTANFAPRGDPIVVAEGIKLHLVYGDGSSYEDLLDSNETYRVYGDAVWSPDGKTIALVIHYLGRRSADGTIKCKPCRAVALYTLDGKKMSVLQTPDKLDAEAPRWTEDGRLIVLVHPQEPAKGIAYVYNTAGQGQVAQGTFALSASHDAQKWHPWLPGRTWQAGLSERADSYYRD